MAALGTKVIDGRLELELPAVPERHRTRSTALPPWTGIIAGARAVGEQALSDAAFDASARQCGTASGGPNARCTLARPRSPVT